MRYLKLYENFDERYKQLFFSADTADPMFDYYYPDLSNYMGRDMTDEQTEETYIATNDKRHLHVSVHPSLQREGLAAEMIKAFIYREGPRIIPKGRITNPNVMKVLDKVDTHLDFTVSDEGDHYLIDEY